MKKGDKKGLSSVITTLIIILLVLVAVGIIWIVMKNIISEGSEQIVLGKIMIDLEIKQIVVDNSTNNISISVKRNPGKGELSGLKFIFDDGISSEVLEQTGLTLEELATKNFDFHLNDLDVSNIKIVSIAPIFKSGSVGNAVDVYEVEESGETGGQDCEDDLGGTCCSTGQSCQGGSFQSSSDCGSLCCVGGTCVSGCTPETCSSLGYECGAWANGTCSGTLNCGTCNSTSDCIAGTCVLNETKFVINLGAISWWKFEGNADDEFGSNHGALNGGVNCSANGKYGMGCEFDGDDDYVDCGNDASLNITNAITIGAWAKSLENDKYQGIAGKIIYNGGSIYGYGIEKDTSNKFRMSVGNGSVSNYFLSDNAFTDSNWHHIVGVKRSNTFYLYIDGIEQADTETIDFIDSGSNLCIGKWYDDVGGYSINGSIDEVMIFNKALSESEIQELYGLDLS